MSLSQGIVDTAFLTFIHNQDAIGYFLGAALSIGLLLIRPSRFATLLLIGFITLFIGFEYNKHIIEPLQDQTIASLGVDDSSTKIFVLRAFQKLLPVGFFTIGWGAVFLAIILRSKKS